LEQFDDVVNEIACFLPKPGRASKSVMTSSIIEKSPPPKTPCPTRQNHRVHIRIGIDVAPDIADSRCINRIDRVSLLRFPW